MKALVQDAYGSADVLKLREIERPRVATDEVCVRVHAAGLDRGVWHVMTALHGLRDRAKLEAGHATGKTVISIR